MKRVLHFSLAVLSVVFVVKKAQAEPTARIPIKAKQFVYSLQKAVVSGNEDVVRKIFAVVAGRRERKKEVLELLFSYRKYWPWFKDVDFHHNNSRLVGQNLAISFGDLLTNDDISFDGEGEGTLDWFRIPFWCKGSCDQIWIYDDPDPMLVIDAGVWVSGTQQADLIEKK